MSDGHDRVVDDQEVVTKTQAPKGRHLSGRLRCRTRLETVRGHHLGSLACKPLAGSPILRAGRRTAPRFTTSATAPSRPRCTVWCLLLAAQPKLVTPVLQVVHRVITRFLLDQAGLKADEADSGAVTLIQRFGSAANLNIHLHCLVLDGVYRCGADGEPVFSCDIT